MSRAALASGMTRLDRKTTLKHGSSDHADYVRILREIERDSPFRPCTDPAPPPTVIDMPVAVAPPEPEPPPRIIGGQPSEFPEPIRPVFWRVRGPQDWAAENEDMGGRCLTEYDPLAYLDEEDA